MYVHWHLEVSGSCWLHPWKLPHRSRQTPKIMGLGEGGAQNSAVHWPPAGNQISLHRVMTILGEPLLCVLSTKLGNLKNVTNDYFSNEEKIVTKCQFSLVKTTASDIHPQLPGPWSLCLHKRVWSSYSKTWSRRDREILCRNIFKNVFILLNTF